MISKISNISFTSTPIYDVKVKKREGESYKNIDAVFSRLNSCDKNDIKAMNRMGRKWWRSDYIKSLKKHFSTGELSYFSTFYALELKGKGALDKRIISLCEVRKSHATYPGCCVDILQTSPEISKRKKPKYKGAGEVTLYGVIREAKENHTKQIDLISTDKSSGFYKHIGFEPDEYSIDYSLPYSKYEKYISRVERKYDFSSKGEKR